VQQTLDDLERIESMTSSTLAFARDDSTNEPRKPFELGVLFSIYVSPPPISDTPPLTTAPPNFAYGGRSTALKGAFTNPIDNAIMCDGSAKVLSTADAITVTTEDYVPGIAEDEMEKVFAPFSRVDPSRSRESGRTGLGLEVVRSVGPRRQCGAC
jgi:light-regulated signal transduction histidine kinase (bacteriophytochrome)